MTNNASKRRSPSLHNTDLHYLIAPEWEGDGWRDLIEIEESATADRFEMIWMDQYGTIHKQQESFETIAEELGWVLYHHLPPFQKITVRIPKGFEPLCLN